MHYVRRRGAGCYAIACHAGGVHTLQANRDRLIADLASASAPTPARCGPRSTSRSASLPHGHGVLATREPALSARRRRTETALDHAVALYSINGAKAGQGVDGSGRGGNDYNRIYLGFDELAKCVMRNFAVGQSHARRRLQPCGSSPMTSPARTRPSPSAR